MPKKKKEKIKEEKVDELKSYVLSLEIFVDARSEKDAVEVFKNCIKDSKYTDEDIAVIFDNDFVGMFGKELNG